MSRIGFIGVGNMGAPMAQNLIRSGHTLKVFDLSERAISRVVAFGAVRAQSVCDAAKGVEFVFTMLPTGRDVRQVFSSEEFTKNAGEGTLFIDSSTIDIESALAVHEITRKAGFEMLDAPVSGGTAGAEKSTLTFMCGGKQEAFDRGRNILKGMGNSIIYCGGPGQGQVVKICNNMVAGVISLATAEAFVLGEKLGVDRKIIYDVMSTSSGNSWILNNVCPLPGGVPGSGRDSDFKPGFAADLMLKDLRLSQSAAQLANSATPLGSAATVAFQQHVNNGYGALDAGSICKLIDPDIQ